MLSWRVIGLCCIRLCIRWSPNCQYKERRRLLCNTFRYYIITTVLKKQHQLSFRSSSKGDCFYCAGSAGSVLSMVMNQLISPLPYCTTVHSSPYLVTSKLPILSSSTMRLWFACVGEEMGLLANP